MITLTVEVTNTHIINGKKRDCSKCPIALAIWEAMDDPLSPFEYAYRVEAGTDLIYLYDAQGNEIYRAYTPDDAEKFMRQFDTEIDVKPALMSFTFFQPSES